MVVESVAGGLLGANSEHAWCHLSGSSDHIKCGLIVSTVFCLWSMQAETVDVCSLFL